MEAVKVIANPLRGENSVVSIKRKKMQAAGKGFSLKLTLIPDREIIEDEAFDFALESVDGNSYETVEAFAKDVMQNVFGNALPYYALLSLKYIDENTKLKRHIQVVKQQPKYKIPEEIKDSL